ncbi:DNA-binding transcriptional MocR family regulator [Pseudonocardia hierapolitana]|uniref:DNA-binding transcriptional MocR family regulator n=1 Tax=Pseudonocardia hierapolitana TaxID=1128676 RepID=A0A561SPE1_9PSEU|nr:PLP-dependent aminotransferase family protein [Pseudonocardia hierapolitana]TWF76727.1 DNA-binding transcriptional MocR family regulator [Pseudonocardia hierapolitana]
MDDYRALADAVGADIAAGRLRAGDRLPTQRRFARDRGIAVSTASRVYGELSRRGLVTGEVGRGTFVRAAPLQTGPALAEHRSGIVDLEMSFPILDGQAALMAPALSGLLRPDGLRAGLSPGSAAGTEAARRAAADLLACEGWTPRPDQLLFAGNGRQAIAAAIGALVPVGGRLGVEALTYPVTRTIAARLGVEVVPLAVDAEGLQPDAVRAAGRLDAVFVQPTMHNPLGVTMPVARRRELADVLVEHDVPAVEDRVYSFLRDDPPPLAAFAPEHTVVVDSLSKRVASGCTLGFLVPPMARHQRVRAAIRAGGWLAPSFAVEAATRWITEGVVAEIQLAKRVDAAERQAMVAERLAGFAVRADPASYHCWWELPPPWRAETFVAAAARRGIAVTPAASYAAGAGHAPSAVRLALATPALDTLATALDVLAGLGRGAPGDDGTE